MIEIVSHTRSGIANITSYLRQSTDEKYFYEDKRLEIRKILRKLCEWERCNCNRGKGMPGPDTYAGQHPAQHERFGIYGIPKGEECVTHLSEMGKYEIRIPKPRVLV